MVKFAHIADCHLGGWRQEELQKINFQSFQKAIEKSIEEQVDFILIAGDLFDSAYPPIEILKDAFAEFKKVREANIPVYLIAGSHDFSASGKTFLDVLEKAGFCKNVEEWEHKEERIHLKPTMHNKIAIYGYPGRKSGMELEDLRRVSFDSMHPFTIFMIHTTIKDVIGTLPIDFIEKEKLPLADYYAMGHIHKRFEEDYKSSKYVYPGPTFPNNFQELVDLQHGSFHIVEVNAGKIKTKSIHLPLKEVVYLEIELDNGLTATQKIISEIDKHSLKDKIVLLKLKGILKEGKTGDIAFNEIEEFARKKGSYVFLRNISALKTQDTEFSLEQSPAENVDNIEEYIIQEYTKKHPTNFDKYLPRLMGALSMDKKEDEKSAVFEERLVSELKSVLDIKEEFA